MARKRQRKEDSDPIKTVENMGEARPVEPVKPGRWGFNEWVILGLILVVGLSLRLVYLQEMRHEPEFTHPFMDPQYNDYWARAMVSGDWTPPEGYPDPLIRTTPHGRPPGYPYFLAFIYWVSGSSYLAPRLVQMTIGLVNVVLLYLLGRRLFGKPASLIAAAFMATYWVFVHFEGELTYPSVAVCVLLTMMLVLQRWQYTLRHRWAALVGLLLGIFALFRPNGMLFLPVLLAWMGWVVWRADAARKQTDSDRHSIRPIARKVVVTSGLVLAGVLLALGPAFLRNYVVAHDFVFLSSYGGVNLWAGNNATADGVTPKIPHLKEIAGFEDWTTFHYPLIVRGLGQMLGKPDLKFSEASNYFYQQAKNFIIHHPFNTLALLIKKSFIFWGPIETTNDRVLHYAKLKSPTLHFLPGFPWVLALFVMGTSIYAGDVRKRLRESDKPNGQLMGGILFLLFIFTYFTSVVIYFVAGRYRVPVIPFLLLFGGYGVWRVAEMTWAGERQRTIIWCGVAVGVFCFGSIPWAQYEPDLVIWHHQHAKAYESDGQLDKAIAEVQEELRIKPTFTEGRNYLAMLLSKAGRRDEAMAVYQKTIESDPGNEVALNNLADELLKQGHAQEALPFAEAAVKANPRFSVARHNLGNILLKLGRTKEAMAQYEEVVRLDPTDRFADYNLGNTLSAQDRQEEALPYYERAAKRDPQNPDVYNNWGLALAKLGKSTEAIACYERALTLNPAYANAFNNLGLELAKQGKQDEAEKQYQKAITLNPTFARAYNNLGNLYTAEKAFDKAETQYKAALQADPKDGDAEFNLGNIRLTQQRWTDAETFFRTAIQKNPANPDIPNNLANALAKQGRFDEAICFYEQALRMNPRYGNAHCNLGLLLAALGQTDQAVAHLRQALELNPNDVVTRNALSQLTGTEH